MPLETGKSEAAFGHNVATEQGRNDAGTSVMRQELEDAKEELAKARRVGKPTSDLAEKIRLLEAGIRRIETRNDGDAGVAMHIDRLAEALGVLEGRMDAVEGARADAGDVRIVYNKLLGGWYVVRGPHQAPLSGKYSSKEEAKAWLERNK